MGLYWNRWQWFRRRRGDFDDVIVVVPGGSGSTYDFSYASSLLMGGMSSGSGGGVGVGALGAGGIYDLSAAISLLYI